MLLFLLEEAMSVDPDKDMLVLPAEAKSDSPCHPTTAMPSGRCPHRDGHLCPGFGRTSHEHVIQHHRAFDYCSHVSRIAVWPQWHRDVASRIKLYASQRDGHGAAASCKAATWASADGKHSWGSSESASRSGEHGNGGWHASAGFGDGENQGA